jgi:hypothetical protein
MSKTECKRGASLTSQNSLNTLKVDSEAFSLEGSDALPDGKPRELLPVKPPQPVSLPHLPVSSLTNPATCLKDQHPSPLDALLSPPATAVPQTPSLPRDSVAGSDFGEVRLDDDGRFSTVSLSAATRDSTVAIKSPIDEQAPKPWTDEEPAPAPSESTGASVRASFLLQILENDATSRPRRSLDGQQKLQEVFERAQRDSQELEGEATGVDWGECFSAAPAPTAVLICV